MHGTHYQCKVTPAHLLILLAMALFINGNKITPPSLYHHLLLFFFGKLYHHLHTTTDQRSDPPSFSFFFWVNYTTTFIPPLIGAQTYHLLHPSWLHCWHHHLSLDPLISKINKQTFQFKQSPKSLTHYSVFLSLSVSDFSSMASLVGFVAHQQRCSSLVGFFRFLIQNLNPALSLVDPKKKKKIYEKPH